MNDFSGLYDVRDYRETDRSFILATFLRGLYYGDSWFSEIPKDIFMSNYKRVVEALINSPNVVIKVACLKEDADVILGYSILSKDFSTLHWLYVKSAWRKKGIGKSLIPAFLSTYTHLSALGKSLRYKLSEAIFNPFNLS
jgi:GNAT superfamily N-acetyltransferase